MIYVIPAAGLKVPDPALVNTPQRHLPPEGRLVIESPYWARRLRDGDVTEGAEPVDQPAA